MSADNNTEESAWKKTLFDGLGLALGDDGVVKPAPDNPAEPAQSNQPTTGLTFGESTRIRDENKELDEAAKAEAEKKGEPEEKAEPAKVAAPEKKEPAPTDPPAPVKVEKRAAPEKAVNDAIEKAVDKLSEVIDKKIPQQEPKREAEKKPEADPLADLDPLQRDEVELYQFAAKQQPDKFKGFPEKLTQFYKANEDYVRKAYKEDPEFDVSNPDYQKFLQKNKPVIDVYERKKLERQRISEEIRADLEEKQKPVMEEFERKQKMIEAKPIIEKVTTEFGQSLTSLLEDAEEGDDLVPSLVKQARENGWKSVVAENPIYGQVVADIFYQGVNLAAEFTTLKSGAMDFDPDKQSHVWLAQFIKASGEDFAKNGGMATVRDGKKFLPVADFHEAVSRDATAPLRFFTFNDVELLSRLAANTKANITAIVKREEERLTKSGYSRAPKQPKADEPNPKQQSQVPKPEENKPKHEPPASPKATPSAAPGAASSKPENTGQNAFSEREFQLLGVPIPK